MKIQKVFLTLIIALTGFYLSSCDNKEDKLNKYLDRGDTYFENQEYIKAQLEYRNAAKISPTNTRAIYSIGLTEEAQGHLQSAISAYLIAEQQDQNYEPAILKLAQIFLTAQKHSDSKIRVDRLLAQNPDNTDAHALNASLYLKNKNYEAAKKEIELTLAKDPENIIAHSVRYGIYMAQKQYSKALDAIDKALELHPEETSLLLLKATAYSEQNDIDNVTKTYEEIFRTNPESIKFRFDLVKIMTSSDLNEKAEQILRKTVEDFPDNPEAKKRLSSLVETRKGMSAAEKEIRSYIENTPNEKMYHLWLADLYIRNKLDDLAISTLKNVINTDQDEWISLNARTSLAGIQLSRGDLELASRLIESVLAKDVNNKDALLIRSGLEFALGDYQKAISDLRTIIRDTPQMTRASRTLAEALLIQGHSNLAIDTLEQAYSTDPGNLGTQVRLAQIYASEKNNKKAMELLSSVTETAPSYPIAWESIARLEIENKKWGKAKEAIEKLEDLENQKTLATFLKGQVYAGEGKKDLAFNTYMEIIENNPLSPITEHAISSMLSLSSEPEHLQKTKEFILSLDKKTATLNTVLGGLYAAQGQNDKAEQAFMEAIKMKPVSQGTFIALAKILIYQGKTDKALYILEEGEKMVPSETEASMIRADLLLSQKNDVEGAIKIYRKLLAYNSNLDTAANNLAQIIADYKSYDKKALEIARLEAERFINSNNPYYLDTLGWVYLKLELLPQAKPLLKKAVEMTEKNPNPQILYHYGKLLFENGQKEEAKTYLEQAVASNIKFHGHEEAEKLLNKIK